MQPSNLNTALAYRQAGLSLIPCTRSDKRPIFDLLPRNDKNEPTWEPFKTAIADESTIRKFFHNGAAIAIICGKVSGNLECLDIDNKLGNAESLYAEWRTMVEDNKPGLIDRLVIERTQNGGYHIWYRCDVIEGPQKLARALDTANKVQTTFETKGDGGYVLCYPTPGYTLIQGDLENPPIITPDDRALLLLVARAQNTYTDEARIETGYSAPVGSGLRPGDDYNARIDSSEFQQLIERHGWRHMYSRGENDYYMRPDKKRGSIGASWHRSKRVWYVFTSSSEFEPDHGYSAFSVYIKLEHGGSVKDAARELGKRGYGDKAHASQNAPRSDEKPTDEQKPPTEYLTLEDSPEVDTRPYVIDKQGRMAYIAPKVSEDGETTFTQKAIADFSATIVQELVEESGNRKFLIKGKTIYGTSFELTINAGDFSEIKKLKAELTIRAGSKASFAVGMEKHLGTAIQKLSNDVAVIRRYIRTGWESGYFLIPGRQKDDLIVELSDNLPYSFNDSANLDIGLQALESLILAMPPEKSTAVLSTIFLAPMAMLANLRNERCGMFVSGRTGSLKSSWTQAAMCTYGAKFMDDKNLIKMGQGATNNALMTLAIGAYDLPLFLDNYKPNTGNGSRDFINLVHNILEGGEKKRLNRASELKDGRPVFAWPIITGEDVPEDDAASLARMLVVTFPFQDGKENTELSSAQKNAPHLPAIGRAWIEWLESDEGKTIAAEIGMQFDHVRSEWAQVLRLERADMVNILRVASNLATHTLVWRVLKRHPTLGALAKKYEQAHMDGLIAVAKEMATYTAESLEAARFINVLRELLASGRALLLEPHQSPDRETEKRHIGWRSNVDNSIFLLPAIARQMVASVDRDGLSGMSDKTLFSQLDNLKHIASKGKDKTTVVRRLGADNNNKRVLHLRASALEDSEELDESGENE